MALSGSESKATPSHTHTHTLFPISFHFKCESVIALITAVRLLYQTLAATERETHRQREIGLVFPASSDYVISAFPWVYPDIEMPSGV